MRPDTMPAVSWSLPSVGETLSTVCFVLVELHRQRAVAQHQRELVGLPVGERPVISTSRPVIPWLMTGADCTTPSSSIATFFPTSGPAILLRKSLFLKWTLVAHCDAWSRR